MLFCFRVPVGSGVPPQSPPPHPGPAVHSYGITALHFAAQYGNRRIVRLLVASDADVNAQNRYNGCGFFRFGVGGVRRPSPRPVCRAGGRRCTLPRPMADRTRSPSCSCAAPTGPSRTTSTGNAELRRTADRNAQPRACRRTPKQSAEDWGELAQYEAAERQVHSARRLPTRQPPASRAIPPRASCSDGCAVGAHRRRSPNQRGGRQPPTQHFTVTGALAARVPYCTRGSKCRAPRARAAAAIGSVPRTARGGRRACVAS